MTSRRMYTTAFNNWELTHLNTWGKHEKRKPRTVRTTSETHYDEEFWERKKKNLPPKSTDASQLVYLIKKPEIELKPRPETKKQYKPKYPCCALRFT